MSYIVTPRSFRLYENYFSGFRISHLANEIAPKLPEGFKVESPILLSRFIRAVSIRIHEGWPSFEPFAEMWRFFPETRSLLGYSDFTEKFPFDVNQLQEFWDCLEKMTFYEQGKYEVDGVQYLQNSIALHGTSEPLMVSRHPYGTNTYAPIAYIDRILDESGTKTLAIK